jgi:hypothetical protein
MYAKGLVFRMSVAASAARCVAGRTLYSEYTPILVPTAPTTVRYYKKLLADADGAGAEINSAVSGVPEYDLFSCLNS